MSNDHTTAETEAPALGIAGRMAAMFQSNAITPLLAIVALLLGLFAVLVTPREEEPQINVTMANVLIAFPGASSADVHNLVTVPAEQVLSQITGIEHVFSVTRPGLAILTIQFKVGEDRIAIARIEQFLQGFALALVEVAVEMIAPELRLQDRLADALLCGN